MEELKKINYEAGVTTHKDVREAINANVESQNKNNKSYDESITNITGEIGVMNEGIQQNQDDIARDHQTLNTVSANVTKLQSDVSSAQEAADHAQEAAETAQATGTEAKNTANTAQQTAKEVARIQTLTPSGTIPFDAVHEDGLTLESLDYDLEPVDLDADVVLGVTVELYPSATTGDKMRAKGVFVANLTLKGTPSSRRALNWKASAKYGVQDSRQYNNATRTGDATGYITDENFGQNGGIVHGNLFWCKADKKVYHYTTSTTNNYGVFVNPADNDVLMKGYKFVGMLTEEDTNNKNIGTTLQKYGNQPIWGFIGGFSELERLEDRNYITGRLIVKIDKNKNATYLLDNEALFVSELENLALVSKVISSIVNANLERYFFAATVIKVFIFESNIVGTGYLIPKKALDVFELAAFTNKGILHKEYKVSGGIQTDDFSITPVKQGYDILPYSQADSAEDFMKSMFLQFDEVQSTIEMASGNSMGYDIADPDDADSGITKANIILAQTVTYNGGTRAKGTFVAQFTTASGTKYALNWKHSSKLGLADSRYYNNAGANPFTSGTETDPTKYITDDATFKSTEFRGIRGENTYLCKGTGAVYVRDTQQTRWYKVVIDPSMWAESN